MLRVFLRHCGEVGVPDQAFLAGEADEPFTPHSPDQGQADLAGDLHPPGGETGPRGEGGDAHQRGLDDHFGGQAPGGVEDFVGGGLPLHPHPAGDLVDGVVAADILHIDQRAILPAKDGAVDRARLQIKAGGRVDLLRQRVEPACPQRRGGEGHALQLLHHVAENGADRAAGSAGLLFQFGFIVRGADGADDDDLQVLVIVDGGYLIILQQHVLVHQIADCEVFRVIADCHRRHDFLRVQVDGERAFLHHRDLALAALMIDAGDGAGQAGVRRVGADDQVSRHYLNS